MALSKYSANGVTAGTDLDDIDDDDLSRMISLCILGFILIIVVAIFCVWCYKRRKEDELDRTIDDTRQHL